MKLRRLMILLHRWAGLLLTVPLILISVTGAILVYDRELDVAFNGHLWRTGSTGPTMGYAAAVEAAARAWPEDPPHRLQPPESAGHAYHVITRNEISVFLDPTDGRLIGTRDYTKGFFRTVVAIHLRMFAPDDVGGYITGGLSIAMILFVGSGIYLWWPKGNGWRIAFGMRRNAPKLVVAYDLHRLVGLYGGIILLILGLTGALMAFPSFGSLVSRGLTGSQPVETAPVPTTGAGLPVDRLVDAAHRLYPDARIHEVRLPQAAGDPLSVRLRLEGEPWRIGRTFVNVDPSTGQVLQDRNASIGGPPVEQIESWYLHLHLGHWGERWSYAAGFATRAVWFVATLLPVALSVTGVLVWWWRRRKRRVPPAPLPVSVAPQ